MKQKIEPGKTREVVNLKNKRELKLIRNKTTNVREKSSIKAIAGLKGIF